LKKTGIVIIVIGILFTLITTFKFFTREKIADVGSLKVTASVPHRINWSPYLGVGIILAGATVFVFGRNK
jgi:uncharacterized membrane protein YidH (DUF202 family)